MTTITRTKRRVSGSGKKNREPAKPIKPRTTQARSSAQVKRLEQPEGALIEVTYTASELVPVAEYANVSVGPIQVTRTYYDPGHGEEGDKLIEQAVRDTGGIVSKILAEDRAIVEESVRQHNAREKENAKSSPRKGR